MRSFIVDESLEHPQFEELKIYLEKAGFSDIRIETQKVSKEYAEKWGHNLKVGEYIMSASIKAIKL